MDGERGSLLWQGRLQSEDRVLRELLQMTVPMWIKPIL